MPRTLIPLGVLRRPLRNVALMLLLLFLLLFALWFTLPRWLPTLANRALPDDLQLRLDGRPGWRQGSVQLPAFRLSRPDCVWLRSDGGDLTRRAGAWRLHLIDLRLDTACVDPSTSTTSARDPLAQWQGLPAFSVLIDRLTVTPWQAWAGRLTLTHAGPSTRLAYQSDKLAAEVALDDRQLTLERLSLNGVPAPAPVVLQGKLTLAPGARLLPERGALQGGLTLANGTALTFDLNWSQQQGVLSITDSQNGMTLVHLPWRISAREWVVSDGRWRWPYATQALAGGIALTLTDWRDGLAGLGISARLNVLTQGLRGRANAVLNIGPGPLRLTDNRLPFRLNGMVNDNALSLDVAIPGELRGDVTAPYLALLPGALLRLVGGVSDMFDIDSARLPLAGVQLSSAGVNGRLQAILQARAGNHGRFTLHLDGKAVNFWPDAGDWRWRLWGNGELRPFGASWRIAGRGAWQELILRLSAAQGEMDRFRYGLIDARAPRLRLTAPLVWRRGGDAPALAGKLEMSSAQVRLQHGGALPAPRLTLALSGRSPDDWRWRGTLQAGALGPVQLNGRWDGARLRGQAWWPKQPLRVFAPLLQPALSIRLRQGEFYAQSAFSASTDQGFIAGGHGVLTGGDLWYGDSRLAGVRFSLSYRLAQSRLQLGIRQPAVLHIDEIISPIALRELDTGLKGFYPFDDDHPLTLTHMTLQTLGGQVSLTPLRLPQHVPAVLKVQGVEMSELITALKPKQFAISGRVSGELPLLLDDATQLIPRGWITSDNLMTLRLDPQFADALAARDFATAAAVDWLRYMEISRLRATLNLRRAGDLTLNANIAGTGAHASARRAVHLNYSHQENIWQLWRSLRFGGRVEQLLEQQAAAEAPAEGEP